MKWPFIQATVGTGTHKHMSGSRRGALQAVAPNVRPTQVSAMFHSSLEVMVSVHGEDPRVSGCVWLRGCVRLHACVHACVHARVYVRTSTHVCMCTPPSAHAAGGRVHGVRSSPRARANANALNKLTVIVVIGCRRACSSTVQTRTSRSSQSAPTAPRPCSSPSSCGRAATRTGAGSRWARARMVWQLACGCARTRGAAEAELGCARRSRRGLRATRTCA